MEEQDKTGVEQPRPNGNAQTETAAQEQERIGARRRQLDEVTQAYERARHELNEAVRTLRSEVAKIDLEQARTRAKSWVDENPVLAVFLGVGAGVITGRLLSNAFRSEPPSLSEQARYRADVLRGRGEDYADELGAAFAAQLRRAMHSAEEAGDYVADRGADVAETVSERARDVGRDVSGRAREAGREWSRRAIHASEDASKRAEEITDSLAESTARSVRVLEDAADELTRTLKKRSKKAQKQARQHLDRGLEFSDTVLNAARTAVAAVVVKKVNDWMKALR